MNITVDIKHNVVNKTNKEHTQNKNIETITLKILLPQFS